MSSDSAEAPYRSPEQAINDAFRIEARAVVTMSSFFRDLAGGTVRLKRQRYGDSPYDAHAQAAFVFAVLARLPDHERLVLRLRHGRLDTPALQMHKLTAVYLLADYVLGLSHAPAIPARYAQDIVREWGRLRRHHADAWWATHLGRDEKTLRNWARSWPYRRWPGIVDVLWRLHGDAITSVTDPLIELGLVESVNQAA